ncbi:hypothetical protein [Methanotorris formicicus]|uniref:Uncharacterized protein n=1 Tax=Methanotorris formicicus Mc-S-70 TaxID=647171 RepID=H1KZ23_9EURY|nr:hypothetical protein [Methanotorris formicicus]EHP86448.1 hypothetical protein MetfoDRAFT_1046 [Methanotorris formicicus Mc-S-70]
MKKFLCLLIGLLLIANMTLGAKVVNTWIEVKEENPDGTSYKGDHYYVTYIYTQLDNGEVLKQTIKLNDSWGTTIPAPTVPLSYTLPNGLEVKLFEQSGSQTTPLVSLPYTAKLPVGTKLTIKMNDNYRDNNYADGKWDINITEDGLLATYATEGGGFFHNTSFLIYDNKTGNLLWELPFPYKPNNIYWSQGYWYNFTLPYDGSDATVYDGYRDILNTYSPTDAFKNLVKANVSTPIPMGVIVLTIIGILVVIYLQRMKKK